MLINTPLPYIIYLFSDYIFSMHMDPLLNSNDHWFIIGKVVS